MHSEILIKGHSGCEINVIQEGHILKVRKSTRNKSYFPRLLLQAQKQKRFRETHIRNIVTPAIHKIEESGIECAFYMDYIYSLNFVEYFEQSSPQKLQHFIHHLIELIDWEIKNSPIKDIPASWIQNKFESVSNNIKNNPSLKSIEHIDNILIDSDKVFSEVKDLRLPIGECHGDLTFSNILFNEEQIYLIDFLDSFIESPLLDMVKIRQDSVHGWSYLMYSSHYDNVRHFITLNHIDQKLNDFFSKYSWYEEYYGLFQLLNFLRILQYAKSEKVVKYLLKEINIILKSL